MKKLVFFLALLSLTALEVKAQSSRRGEPTLKGDRMSNDPYPLIKGPILNYQGSVNTLQLHAPYSDPGILLPPMNWDCDPGILLSPKNFNCDPGMIIGPKSDREIPSQSSTFDPYIPPSLQPNTLVTPFLFPGANPFQKQEELRDAGKLYMLEKGFRSHQLFEMDSRTLH